MKNLFTLLLLSCAFFSLSAQTTQPIPPQQTDTARHEVNRDSEEDPIPPPLPVTTTNSDSAVFTFVEEMPSFGTEAGAFAKYLQSAIKYPQAEKEAGKQGTVYVSFIVEKDGSVTNCKVLKSVVGAPGLDKEALRVMSESPKWNPGIMNGKTVRVSITMPVKFVLN